MRNAPGTGPGAFVVLYRQTGRAYQRSALRRPVAQTETLAGGGPNW